MMLPMFTSVCNGPRAAIPFMSAMGGKRALRVAPSANRKLSRYLPTSTQTTYATAKIAAITKT